MLKRILMMSARPALTAIFRCHAGAGARVALRNSWMAVAVALFVLVVVVPNPLGLLYALARSLAVAGDSPWALYLIAVLAAGLAHAAVPQVMTGSSGWMRSLPASAVEQRRALVGALVLAQAPVLFVALCGVLTMALAPGMPIAVTKVLAIAPIAAGAAMMAMPSPRRVWIAATIMVSMLLAMNGSVLALIASCLALAGADAIMRDRPVRKRRARWRGRGPLPQRIAWRALSWRVAPRLLPAAIPLAGAWLFRTNNELSSAAAADTARLCGVVAVTVALAGLADALHRRRPVWGWARSLPWSATQRIMHDATTMMVGVIPVVLVVAMLDVGAAVTVAAVSPLLALIAAGAIRRAGTRRTAAAGEVLGYGIILVAALAFSNWMIGACLLAAPLALRHAARRERRVSASQWLELHHSVEGDGLSWSAP